MNNILKFLHAKIFRSWLKEPVDLEELIDEAQQETNAYYYQIQEKLRQVRQALLERKIENNDFTRSKKCIIRQS